MQLLSKWLAYWGLSPRVRGNLCRALSAANVTRSIPACTGEPQLNGKAVAGGWRSIPACTGEPLPLFRCWASPAVYPRVYGGTKPRKPKTPSKCGLSPRVRGNRGWAVGDRAYVGSIPACTGEPVRITGKNCSVRVYPRVYGGTTCFLNMVCLLSGLSPRVRGNHRFKQGQGRWIRSIPACTGEPAM